MRFIINWNISSFIFQFALLTAILILSVIVVPKFESDLTSILIVYSLWIISVWLTQKHKLKFYQKRVLSILSPNIKSFFIVLLLSWFLSGIFMLKSTSKTFISYSIIIYSILELFFYVIVIILFNRFIRNINKTIAPDIDKYKQFNLDFIDNPSINIDLESLDFQELSISKDKVYELCKDHILTIFNQDGRCGLYDNSSNPLQLFDVLVLKEKVNNFRRINSTIINASKSVQNGGYLICVYTDLEKVEEGIKEYKFTIIRFFLWLKYYFFHRALLKLPFINKIYFAITNGENRVISKAEIWGRLSYCGFEIVSEIEVEKDTYLLSRKLKTQSENPTPSFFPVIALDRVGLFGTIIRIHKIRTMYPYSEFIQKRVFEMNSLSAGGKFNNDFRITKIGKFFRKYWLDELPQVIDWLRGEIKLVGIRAMSQHYFSLYSEEYQNLYIQVKPGIFSPIFDDNNDRFEDIQRIEKAYLIQYLQRPFRTDMEYFIITIKQIFKGLRSK